MDHRVETIVEAIRRELGRQAEAGNAAYNGATADGLDSLEGYFDLAAVARAAIEALHAAPPLHAPSAADLRALRSEEDERQTERQAPADAWPGESDQGGSIG